MESRQHTPRNISESNPPGLNNGECPVRELRKVPLPDGAIKEPGWAHGWIST